MIGLVGYIDEQYGFNDKCVKAQIEYWHYTLKSFDGTHLCMIDHDKTGVHISDSQITFGLYDKLTDVLDDYSSVKFVFFETQDVIPSPHKVKMLKDYKHPDEDVFYVFGSDFDALQFADLDKNGYLDGNDIVTIEMVESTRYPSQVGYWAHVSAGMVLYDRMMKEKIRRK